MFVRSQIRQQTITMHVLPKESKGNQAMKFDQLIKHRISKLYLKNYTENEVERLFPDLFLFFKKGLCKVKASSQHLSCIIFW